MLGALASRDFYQANMLLNEELNPNCWKRNQSGEIETPFSLIIKSCLEGITKNKEEILTKLLKHKDLDFSYEQYPQLKQTIKQAITERLTDTINKKDLDDVKKLVEDNCFMSHAIVTAALRDASEPTESIKNYLNEKFPASVEQPVASTNIPAGFEECVQELVDELERTKAQLTEKEQELANKTSRISQLKRDLAQVRQEKAAQQDELIQYKRIVYERTNDTVEISQLERDLKQVKEERDRLSSENRRLKSLNNKNEKSSEASAQSRKQSNYASTSFVLSGAFAIGAYLTIPNLEICIPLAVAALSLFLIGCYFLYKKNERGVGPDGAIDNPRITRVLSSFPNFAESSYTY